MADRDTKAKVYHRRSFRIIAGTLVATIFVTMVLHPAIFIEIRRSTDGLNTAVDYLADYTEYVNKSTPRRMLDYLQTFGTADTLEDYYRLASTQIANEKYDDALTNIEQCIVLYDGEGEDLYIDLLLKRGCLQVVLGDYDNALKSLDIALAEDPVAADIYLIKAQVYSEQGNQGALAECLTEYLKIKPGDNSVRFLLAQAEFAKGNYRAAARQYEKVLETDPNAETEYLHGLSAMKIADFAAGETSFTGAIAKDDSFDGIYYYRGVCHMALGNYEEAVKDLTVSIEKEDMLQVSYYTRGVCLLGNNQYEEGLSDIMYAIDLNSDEKITKQAQSLIAEIEALPAETVLTETMAQPGEIQLPEGAESAHFYDAGDEGTDANGDGTIVDGVGGAGTAGTEPLEGVPPEDAELSGEGAPQLEDSDASEEVVQP